MQTSIKSPKTQEQLQPVRDEIEIRPELWAFGPLPPPVTGMTLVTSKIVSELASAGPVKSYNWSPGMQRRSLWMRLRRNLRMIRSVVMLLVRGRVQNGRLYIVSNSDSGLYTTAIAVWVAKRLGYVIYLHHHVYFYIDEFDRRMAWIVRQLGPRDVHVVHNAEMIDHFRERYPNESGFEILYPSIIVTEISEPRTALNTPLRLGLLSNLSAAKGLSDALDTFALLRERNRDVTLTLAGPVTSGDTQQLIDDAVAKYPGRVRALGSVFGEDKKRFFAEIDVFLFPTKTEAWGLVLNESIAAGVPGITVDRGCLAMVMSREAGFLIDRSKSFVEPAALQVERWIDDRESYRRASQAAIVQATRLRDDGQRTLDDFVRHIFSPLPLGSAEG